MCCYTILLKKDVQKPRVQNKNKIKREKRVYGENGVIEKET